MADRKIRENSGFSGSSPRPKPLPPDPQLTTEAAFPSSDATGDVWDKVPDTFPNGPKIRGRNDCKFGTIVRNSPWMPDGQNRTAAETTIWGRHPGKSLPWAFFRRYVVRDCGSDRFRVSAEHSFGSPCREKQGTLLESGSPQGPWSNQLRRTRRQIVTPRHQRRRVVDVNAPKRPYGRAR